MKLFKRKPKEEAFFMEQGENVATINFYYRNREGKFVSETITMKAPMHVVDHLKNLNRYYVDSGSLSTVAEVKLELNKKYGKYAGEDTK